MYVITDVEETVQLGCNLEFSTVPVPEVRLRRSHWGRRPSHSSLRSSGRRSSSIVVDAAVIALEVLP